MTTEDDFQRMLDADPEDWVTRLVFADWLDEQGDPRAEGYRALGALRLRPDLATYFLPWNDTRTPSEKSQCWSWWAPKSGVLDSSLPRGWYRAVKTKHHYRVDSGGSKDFYTRREAEDAAAIAFAKLPPERRAELLAAAPAAA